MISSRLSAWSGDRIPRAEAVRVAMVMPPRCGFSPVSTTERLCISALRERVVPRGEIERAAVPAVGRHDVLDRRCASKPVLDELLPHHLASGALGEAEALPEPDARLQRVALGRALVPDAAQVPGLVREDGHRARRLARGHLILECEPIEVVAALRREVRALAADE